MPTYELKDALGLKNTLPHLKADRNTAAAHLNKQSPPPAKGSVNQLTAACRLLYATFLLGAQGGKHKTDKTPELKKNPSCAAKSDIEGITC